MVGFALQVDCDAILAIATVDDLVVFQVIAVGPEVFPPRVITKQNTDFATAFDTVVLHSVVGVIVSDGDPVIARVENPVCFSQPVFDAPAPENPDPIAFQQIVLDEWALRSATRMQAQVCVVVTVTVLHNNVVADLPADAVTIIVVCSQATHLNTVTVLHPDTAAVITVKVCVVLAIAVEGQVFNRNILNVFTTEKRKQRAAGWLSGKPEILP